MIVFRIKEIRESKNITAYFLSKKANISRSFLSELENNKKTNPSMQTLLSIANVLGVNIKELFYTRFDVESLKKEMYKRIDKYGLNSSEVLEISQLIDLLINIDFNDKKKI